MKRAAMWIFFWFWVDIVVAVAGGSVPLLALGFLMDATVTVSVGRSDRWCLPGPSSYFTLTTIIICRDCRRAVLLSWSSGHRIFSGALLASISLKDRPGDTTVKGINYGDKPLVLS